MPSDAQGEYREMRPGSRGDFGLDWAPWLGADTIATSVWVVPSGITEITPEPSKTNTTTTIWLHAPGPAGEEFVLENIITTAGGREWHRPLRIKVVALVTNTAQSLAAQQLLELNQTLHTGVKEVETRPGGFRRVEYRDKKELDDIKAELEEQVSGPPAAGNSRCSLTTHRRG